MADRQEVVSHTQPDTTIRHRAVTPPFNVTPRPDIPTPEPGGNPLPWPEPTRQTVREVRDILLNESAAGQVRSIIIGKAPQGLKLIYANSFNNGMDAYLVGAIGEGPLQKITPKLDGTPMIYYGPHWAAGGVVAWVYDGSQTAFQETASGLFALDPTWITNGSDGTHGYDYLAFVVFKVHFDPNISTDIPTITFDVQGYRDLYDSRDTTRKYAENVGMAIHEVLSNTRWGARLPLNSTYFDETTWSEAETDCDVQVFPAAPTAAPTLALGVAGLLNGYYEYTYTRADVNGIETIESPISAYLQATNKKIQVTVPSGDTLTASYNIYRLNLSDPSTHRKVGSLAGNSGGVFTDNMSDATWASQPKPPTVMPNQKRYPIGINISEQAQLDDWLETLRGHCLGVVTTDNGRYQLRINKAVAGGYTYQDFSEFSNWDGAGAKPNIDPLSIEWSRLRRMELFNEVEVKFVDQQNNYAPGSIVKSRASVIAGTEMPRRAVYNLQGAPDSSVASRLATQLLNLAWDDATFSFDSDRSAIAAQPWDVVRLTGAGLSQQRIRVRSVRSKGEGFTIKGTEYQPASFSDTVVQADAPLSVGSVGLSQGTPPDPTGISIAPASPVYLAPDARATLSFTAPATPFFDAVEIYMEYDAGSGYGTKTLWAEAKSSPFTLPPFLGLGTYRLTFVTRTITGLHSAGVIQTYTLTSGGTYALSGALIYIGQPTGLQVQKAGQVAAGRYFGIGGQGVGANAEDLYLESNSVFDGTSAWNRDNTALPAWRMRFGSGLDAFEISRVAAGANPITWPSPIFAIDSSGTMTAGSVPDAQLSANVALLNRAAQVFSGSYNQFVRVGVGTTGTPIAPLDVYHDSAAYSATGYMPGTIAIRAANTSGHYSGIEFTDVGQGRETFFGVVGRTASISDFVFQGYDGTAAYKEYLRIAGDTGNVGIGLAAPASRLSVAIGGATIGLPSDACIALQQSGNVGDLSQLALGYTSGATVPSPAAVGYITTNGAGNTNGALIFATRSVTTATVPTERMRIDSSGNALPGATFSYDLGATATKWRALYAAELRVETLVAQKTIATIGGRILVGPTCKLVADLAAAATTITVDNNQMVNGDIVYLESAPGGVQQIEFIAIASAASANGPNWNYTVTRNLDATGANNWSAGDAVFNTGQTGNGFIDLYSVRGTKASTEIGPTIVGNVRNSATFNDWSPRWAIGNLNGLYGYATDTYGVAMGVPTAAWVKIDPTNGVRIGYNATTKIQLDASGNATFVGAITAASGAIGGWTIGATALTSGSGATTVGLDSGGTNPAIYAGSATPAAAPFRVNQNGSMVCSNATIAGSITATTGSIGGWTIGATTLVGGTNSVTLNSSGGGSITAGNITISNNTISVGSVGLTWNGSQLLFAGNISFTTAGAATFSQSISATGYYVGASQVVGPRGAAVGTADGTLASATTVINAIAARLQGHGLIS